MAGRGERQASEDRDADRRLLENLRRRDPNAVDELSRRFGRSLTRAAFLFLGDSHFAADAAQETLIAAWDGARRTTPATPLRPWLFGILFHRCRKLARTASRRRRRESAAARPIAASEDAAGSLEEPLEELRRALERLEEPLREVIILRYEKNLSVAETSQALGIPSGTVKSRTATALRRLKEILERWQ